MHLDRLRLLLLVITTLSAGSASSHHSAAAFDPELTVAISGTVTSLEWTSPHARLYVDVETDEGETVNWNFELPSPNGLMRKGWTRRSVVAGDRVIVTGFRAREFPLIAIATRVTDADGNSVFSGSGTDQRGRSR